MALAGHAQTRHDRWDSHVQSYLNKTNQIVLDASSRALYGADAPGLSWEEVVERQFFVLFDFRHVTFREQKIFGLLWVMRSIVEYLKKRGPGRRFPPFALYLRSSRIFFPAITGNRMSWPAILRNSWPASPATRSVGLF